MKGVNSIVKGVNSIVSIRATVALDQAMKIYFLFIVGKLKICDVGFSSSLIVLVILRLFF